MTFLLLRACKILLSAQIDIIFGGPKGGFTKIGDLDKSDLGLMVLLQYKKCAIVNRSNHSTTDVRIRDCREIAQCPTQ